ncbi:MAG: aromatic ring-hydroxylating dioxygenase subunit alpha [Burkholderiales bacterium]|nr:aromatic ring-hydroxylating dioxygenase subunit alpha [Burkholderiales bacterium]
MSDLARSGRPRPAGCPLPLAWYFDAAHFAREKRLLFDAGADYIGHERMVPNTGDYVTLAWMDHAKVLVRGPTGVALLSNVCRHRQALMLEGRGNARAIVCPAHRWTYALDGELLGAPRFSDSPCVRLAATPLNEWHGLLFAGPRDARADLAQLACADEFDFAGYALERIEVTDYRFNWKTFMEVYLEVYHVEACHPGLGQFTDADDFRVEYSERTSVQIVGAKNGLATPGSPVYRRWHAQCLAQLRGRAPKYGALWAAYYPGLMLEWYPNVLVVSKLIPRAPDLTTNVVEFYYPEEIALFERDFVAAQQAAYFETAAEDDEICRRIDRGRRALWREGRDDAGPYQSPMEDPIAHFHEWLRRELEQ